MAETTNLKAQVRTPGGTRAARRVRTEGRLPAVLYGHGQNPIPITLDTHDMDHALRHGVHVLEIDVDGEAVQCLIKEVQYDHLNEKLIHVDLARVDLTERVRVTIGIELRGTPKGLSEGGLLENAMANIELECLVTEIPEMLRPSVAHLHVGESLYVRDLELPGSAKALAGAGDVVATVRALAAAQEVEVEEPEAAEPEAAEPEVIRKPKEEEAES